LASKSRANQFYKRQPEKYRNLYETRDIRAALDTIMPASIAERDARLQVLAELVPALNNMGLQSAVSLGELLRGLALSGSVSPSLAPPAGGYRWANASFAQNTEGIKEETRNVHLPSFFWSIFADPQVSVDQLQNLLVSIQSVQAHKYQGGFANQQSIADRLGDDFDQGIICKGQDCVISAEDWQVLIQAYPQYIDLPANRKAYLFELINIINATNLSKADILAVVRVIANNTDADRGSSHHQILQQLQSMQRKTWRNGNHVREHAIGRKTKQPGLVFYLIKVLASATDAELKNFIDQLDLLLRGQFGRTESRSSRTLTDQQKAATKTTRDARKAAKTGR
jgi:hypothetical protein